MARGPMTDPITRLNAALKGLQSVLVGLVRCPQEGRRSTKRLAICAVVGLLGLAATSNPLSAQFVFLGGGATLPVSDFGDNAGTGFTIEGGFGHPVGDTDLSVFAEGFFGRNTHSDVEGEKTSPHGLMAGMIYSFPRADSDSTFYVFGQLGILWILFSSDVFEESTNSGLGLGAGAGYAFPLGSLLTGFVHGRVTHASISDENTSFVGVVSGISIPLGG